MRLGELGPKQLALDLLKRSREKVQMAAVVADERGIFGWGWNHGYTHAEEHAIARSNKRRLLGATIYVAGRRASSGNAVYSKPCDKPAKSCHRRCIAWGLRISFLTKDGTWTK